MYKKSYRCPATKSIDGLWPGRCENGHMHTTERRLIRIRYRLLASITPSSTQQKMNAGGSVVGLGPSGPQLPAPARAVKVRRTKSLQSVETRR